MVIVFQRFLVLNVVLCQADAVWLLVSEEVLGVKRIPGQILECDQAGTNP